MSVLNKFHLPLRKGRGLLIIIMAALLLEFISAAQYYFTHHLMEEELEKRAESELTMKAILIKSTLNSAEDILKNHVWDIRDHLSNPDSIYIAVSRMVMLGRHLRGGFMAFVPGFYPSEDRMFEPYARRSSEMGNTVDTSQIAGANHDYTQSSFYKEAIAANDGIWVDPYLDNEGARGFVTSYAMPVRDYSDSLVGVAGVDVSLEWLRDTIDSRHLYPSSFILLLTEDGKPIIQPSESRVNTNTNTSIIKFICDSTVTKQKSHSQRSTMIHFNIDDRNGTVFYAHMKGVPHWQLAVVCYDDEVYASLRHLRVRLLLLMLLAVGVLLYMIFRYARNEDKLKKKTLEQERISGELRIANDIQQALLPVDEPSIVGVDDVSVEGRLIPAKDVGGDLYNAFVRDGKLFFCIGDVSGKGIPSALIMAITQTLFRNIASRESNPAHIMTQLNEMACRNNKSNYFITLFVGVLDLPTGHLRFCNAGHEIPILINSREGDGGEVTESQMLDVKPNLPIGLFDDFNYVMQEICLERGSSLFLYTDGLTEARNAQDELFGMERVKRLIVDSCTTDPKLLMQKTIAQLNNFTESTEQSDDLTLLAFRYSPKEEPYILNEELTLQNNVQQVEQLSSFVKQVFEELRIGKSLARNLRLAVEEAVVNVMQYAYPAGTTGDINLRITSDGHRLKFIITDAGVSFNPTEVSTADTTLSVEERPIGGLGILLVRKLMDSINYERMDGKNVLTLSKDYVPDNSSI